MGQVEIATPEEMAKARKFIEDLQYLILKHNVELGHEDGHGAFLVYVNPSDADIIHSKNWIHEAHIMRYQ